MERRDFLKKSVLAVGLVGALDVLPPIAAGAAATPAPPLAAGSPPAAPGDPRAPAYLQRVRGDVFLPALPTAARSYPIAPMPLAERLRRKLVPQRGLCSIAPANNVSETLLTGSGSMHLELMGDPYAEQILFHHEDLIMPWKKPLEAPNVADIFPQVRQLVLAGRHRDAMTLALQHMNQSPLKQETEPHRRIPAFLMQLNLPTASAVRSYLRTVNFETSEANIHWTDERGDWLRQTFCSRPDNVIVQRLTAPSGQSLNVRITLQKSAEWSMGSGATGSTHVTRGTPKGPEACDVQHDFGADHLIYRCRLDPSVDNSGYAGVTRIIRTGGTARMDQDTLVIENASSVMLLTRIEHFAEVSNDNVAALQKAIDQITPDYAALLERQRKVQSEMLNRVTVDVGGESQFGMAVEELLADQRSRADFSPALIQQVFDMGRHWSILTTGKHPYIPAEAPFVPVTGTEPGDIRPNEEVRPVGPSLLHMAGAAQGDLRETSDAYFNWIESLAADCRANAKNIFGFRGTSFPLWPQRGMGVSFYYSSNSVISAFWPYWVSAGGLAYRPFWEHYLATGDQDFLRNRIVPGLKDLALFYEDFLTAADKDGNWIFAPSISPENTPTSANPAEPLLVNSALDIAVCRDVLVNLIHACQTLGIESDGVAKWTAILAKMPPYMAEQDGTLKEWAAHNLQEHYAHRHLSHLYGAWPGEDFDPDRSPQLARAAAIANRRRAFDTMTTAVAGETLPAGTRCHRALIGARLKDAGIVEVQLRQLLEQGYISASLRCSRDPYSAPVPDAHAGIPAIIMEMLAYSRPGIIEVLPALPATLVKGSIKGLRTRSFARLDSLAWDMDARTVDLTLTSLRNQDITLLARHGIDQITVTGTTPATAFQPGAANCNLRLPEGKPVEIHLKLGPRQPMAWVNQVS